MRPASPSVIFAVAAGPSIGFGHLVRAGHLVRQLEASPVLALRGGHAAVETALSMGWTVLRGQPAALAATLPDLIVVDDPSAVETRRWIRAARRYGVPVATIHDGAGRALRPDLRVDGSFMAFGAQVSGKRSTCLGPAFAILDPRLGDAPSAVRRPDTVLIALGGGRHVRIHGVRVAQTLRRLAPSVAITLAPGFADAGTLPALPDGCCWMATPAGLADALARTSVAIVAGGVTLYECCATGTPAVALPVVAAQRRTVAAASRRGVAVAATVTSAALQAYSLLSRPLTAAAYGRRGRRLVDGAGVRRVAEALRRLIDPVQLKGVHRAA